MSLHNNFYEARKQNFQFNTRIKNASPVSKLSLVVICAIMKVDATFTTKRGTENNAPESSYGNFN